MDQAGVVTTPDGRQLAYLEVGDPHGPLVLHNHGGPSSRLEAHLLAEPADPINKAVADAMPGAVWHPVEGAGHFVAVGAADEIFAVAAKELGAS